VSDFCAIHFLLYPCRKCASGAPPVPPAQSVESLTAQNDALRAELSALRAAQPLTKEKIDLVIGDIMVATRVRGGTPESRIYFALGSLRDALLDSLADGEAK
jgi:hypothetical protein